jgi:hypothetical protein
MVVAHAYRPSGWLERMRLLRGSFKGKGAVGGMSPFPVADSPETTPPGSGSNSFWLRPRACSKSKHSEINDLVIAGGVKVLQGRLLAIPAAAVKGTGRLILLP